MKKKTNPTRTAAIVYIFIFAAIILLIAAASCEGQKQTVTPEEQRYYNWKEEQYRQDREAKQKQIEEHWKEEINKIK